jgi:hypothetical protein
MFDIPGLDMLSPFLGPAAGAVGPGMDAGGSIAEAASSAWDFGSNAIANIGQNFDPSLIAGPFMPSLGGGAGAGAAGGQAASPLPLGMMDPGAGVADATADFQDWTIY